MMKRIILFSIVTFCAVTLNTLFGQEYDEKSIIKKFGLPDKAYNIILSEDSIPIQWNIPSDIPGLVGVTVAGKPPKGFRMPVAQPTDGSVILNNVPAFDWSFGCSATAAAMLAGYYDNMGLPNMYTGPTNNGVMPMDNSIWGTVIINGELRSQCPLSATRKYVDGRTTRGHVDDYWVSYSSSEPDPYITGGWTQHSYGDCTGDYMKTNQSSYDNADGSTTFWVNNNGTPYSGNNSGNDGAHGLKLFIESRGYNISNYFNQYIQEMGFSNGFTFNQYKAEIDAGRPVLIHVTGHTMIGFGYNTSGNMVYLHDTWDYEMHQMTWGGNYAGLQHESISVIRIQQALPCNITLNQPNTSGDYTATCQVLLDPGFESGSTFTGQIFGQAEDGMLRILQNNEIVFETIIEQDYDSVYPDIWNGYNLKGEKMPNGVYHYVITDDGAEIEKGSFTIE